MLLNFHKIAGGKRAHMHPVMSKLVDDEVRNKMELQKQERHSGIKSD